MPDPQQPAAPPEPKIEALLNHARDLTVKMFHGKTATKKTLDLMGAFALAVVRTQADAGLWSEWAIARAADLAALRCTFEVRQPRLIDACPFGVDGKPRAAGGAWVAPVWVAPVWDFKETPLAFLATEPAPPPVQP